MLATSGEASASVQSSAVGSLGEIPAADVTRPAFAYGGATSPWQPVPTTSTPTVPIPIAHVIALEPMMASSSVVHPVSRVPCRISKALNHRNFMEFHDGAIMRLTVPRVPRRAACHGGDVGTTVHSSG